MTLEVRQFPCLSDNYGYLVRDRATGLVATIDTPDVEPILQALQQMGGKLALILNTHWHRDHAGGNEAIKAATGAMIVAPAEVERISPIDRVVADGDVVELGETRFQVIDTGGHTRQHISYYDAADGVVFVGDTLFALGCGKMFEGTAPQFWSSLGRLAALPDDTLVYCAHEYTASNARFALSVDDGPAVKARAAAVFAARERGLPTVPTTIGAEKAANPFLRAPLLARRLGVVGAPDHEAFAAVRAAKDSFRG
jgi:hydroxyacylglutathione hydrolase